MASVVRMPSVLAGASEAAIASWLVAPGDEVAVGQPLAEIETEKALVEYAAEEAGVVGRLVLAVGDTGEIGEPIAVLVADGETDADIDAALGTETPAPAQAPAPTAPAVTPATSVPQDAPADAPTPSGTWSMAHRPPKSVVDGPSTTNGHQSPAGWTDRGSSPARSCGRSPASGASTSRRSRARARMGGSSAETWSSSWRPSPNAWSPNRFKRQRQCKHQPRSWPAIGSCPIRRCGVPSPAA